MNKTIERERGDAQRLETAAEWMLRLRDAAASEDDILRWVHWCETDPRNQQAFDRAQELWNLTSGLANEVVDGELAARKNDRRKPFAWSGMMDFLNGFAGPRTAIAFASVAALVIGAAWLLRGESFNTVPALEPVRETRLSDGSTMALAPETAVAIRYSEHERALDLQGGEAYFSVAPNKQRPFVVSAGGVRVRAVGTAFNVRRANDRVVVTVAEGTVDVYPQGKSSDAAVRVSAGSQVKWDAGENNPVVASVNPSAVQSWREGRLEYTNEPLSGVIADLNRYSKRKVTIHGEAIKRLHFSGTLLTHATDEWLRALPGIFPIEVKEQDGGYLIQ